MSISNYNYFKIYTIILVSNLEKLDEMGCGVNGRMVNGKKLLKHFDTLASLSAMLLT